jgi:hypothetical protein
VVNLSALKASRPLHHKRLLILIYVRALFDLRAIVLLDDVGQLKNPVTSSGIEPITFWLVAKYRNYLRYHVVQVK